MTGVRGVFSRTGTPLPSCFACSSFFVTFLPPRVVLAPPLPLLRLQRVLRHLRHQRPGDACIAASASYRLGGLAPVRACACGRAGVRACVCLWACGRAAVRACVCACVRACGRGWAGCAVAPTRRELWRVVASARSQMLLQVPGGGYNFLRSQGWSSRNTHQGYQIMRSTAGDRDPLSGDGSNTHKLSVAPEPAAPRVIGICCEGHSIPIDPCAVTTRSSCKNDFHAFSSRS